MEISFGGSGEVFKCGNYAVKVFYSKQKADVELEFFKSFPTLRQNTTKISYLMGYDKIYKVSKQIIFEWYQKLGRYEQLDKLSKNYKEYDHVQVLIMEYIPGSDLLDYHNKNNHGKWPVNAAEEVTRQMLMATQECHNSGFIHRDIKPENFMINVTKINNQEVYSVKLVDFGLARNIIDGDLKYSEAGIGSAKYQSCEAKQGHHSIYSDLAAVGLSMLALTTPESRSEPFDRLLKYISHDDHLSRGSVREALEKLIKIMVDPLENNAIPSCLLSPELFIAPLVDQSLNCVANYISTASRGSIPRNDLLASSKRLAEDNLGPCTKNRRKFDDII
jgi:serine/threonine protein kinase